MTPYLDPDEPRCRPGCGTSLRDTCGRFLAPLPAGCARVVDGAKHWHGTPCEGYLPASECLPPSPPGRGVFGPLGG